MGVRGVEGDGWRGGAKYLYEGSEGNSLTVAWNEHILYIFIFIIIMSYMCTRETFTLNKRKKKIPEPNINSTSGILISKPFLL